MSKAARRYDLYLPLIDNDGQVFADELFDSVERRLIARFRGLTTQQRDFLRDLTDEGVNRGLPILEIASRTITVVPGITGLIDRLEQAGFVNRVRCEKDRRVIYVASLAECGNRTSFSL